VTRFRARSIRRLNGMLDTQRKRDGGVWYCVTYTNQGYLQPCCFAAYHHRQHIASSSPAWKPDNGSSTTTYFVLWLCNILFSSFVLRVCVCVRFRNDEKTKLKKTFIHCKHEMIHIFHFVDVFPELFVCEMRKLYRIFPAGFVCGKWSSGFELINSCTNWWELFYVTYYEDFLYKH
jgi:hypothetical protein